MSENNNETATVVVCKNGERLAEVRYSEGYGLSIEIGPSFTESVRMWFDRLDDTGSLFKDGRHIAEVRAGIRAEVRKAGEAAMWEAKTGEQSGLADGTLAWCGRTYIEVK